MSTLLERLLPAIEEEATNIRHGYRTGLCSISTHSDISEAEAEIIRLHISDSALLYRHGHVFATSALIRRGLKDSAMCAPFIGGGPEVMFSTLDECGLAWVADKWKEWAIGIVRDARLELYGH